MRVKKISAFIMAFMLVLSPFTLFSFAADTFLLKDSGSPEVSMMAMRSIAANEGISMAAAEGNSGTYGYNIEPYSVDFVPTLGAVTSSLFNYGVVLSVPAGSYSFDIGFNADFYRVRVMRMSDQAMLVTYVDDASEISGHFTVSETTEVFIHGTFYLSDIATDAISVSDFGLSRLKPVEGISSGYTYSSGIINKSTRSIFDTISADFGNQPSGKYLINIYHWGDSYDVIYQISDSTESYYLPCTTSGSVTTLVFNHPGGPFTLEGSFTASNDETSVVDGTIYGGGQGSYAYIGGDITANGSLSWVFNITDIVAIPYDQASDSNFGIFAPIIGFFNDHFSSMKSWIATQIDKIAGDDLTKATVDNAASELEQEVNDLNSLHGQLDSQASTLEQQFSNDFAVPSEVAGQTGNLQLMYSGIFSSLGVFSIFIWLPVVLAVIKKLLRL